MPNYDIVVRDKKNKICQFFIGISGDYENDITMNVAEIQKKFPEVNMHTIDTAKNYVKYFEDLGYTIDNDLYSNLLNSK